MSKFISGHKNYFDLIEHNKIQLIVFFLLFLIFLVGIFYITINVAESIIGDYLSGTIYNDGKILAFNKETPNVELQTSYYKNWAIDIYEKTPQESRYWISPILSFVIPSALIAFALAAIVSALIPQGIGFIRQKIEREIINALDKISYKKNGTHSYDGNDELANELMSANMRDLHSYVTEYGISLEDLKALNRGLLWLNGSFVYKFFNLHHGFTIYLRFYFAEKYTNSVMGLVYMGAAFLIIIIGMRGLKFIPSTQPSLVLFALGLEFSMLVVYAVTLMFSKEEDSLNEKKQSSPEENVFLSKDFGNTREVEKLLRMFLKKDYK